MSPYWSAITKHYFQEDFDWIRKSIHRMKIYSIFLILLTVILYYFSPTIFTFWLQELVTVPNDMLILWGIFVSISLFYRPYVMFLNGVSKVTLQLYLMTFGALINIPLSYYFSVTLGLHTQGILLASILSIFPCFIILPLQYKKKKNKKRKGNLK